ncbi:DUF6478 family protein [Falsirhodobacter sp. alg1]|uniref:DUF6478 family protein n=1 Tax=Falsirhodobacter sp. alg1 TaxID=1472418 RepID=UPI0008309F0A|nr:DUF6478 family protein [Falsirhodobacter sp. alg1]
MTQSQHRDGKIEGFLHRRVIAGWTRAASQADTTPPERLMALRKRATALRTQLDRLIATADRRALADQPIPRPLGTDWSWRPELWTGDAISAGLALRSHDKLAGDVTLFHDCPAEEVGVRQIRRPNGQYALQMDVFSFQGSFMSLAIELPEEAVQGLLRKHLICLTVDVEEERPSRISARLNVQHGPNTEQVVRELWYEDGILQAEFDLAYTNMNEARVEKIWLDLIFEDPRMNCIVLKDLTLTRRPRAEI